MSENLPGDDDLLYPDLEVSSRMTFTYVDGAYFWERSQATKPTPAPAAADKLSRVIVSINTVLSDNQA